MSNHQNDRVNITYVRPAAFQAAVILSGCVEEDNPIEGGENGSGEFGSLRLRSIGNCGHVRRYLKSHVQSMLLSMDYSIVFYERSVYMCILS